MNKVMMIVTLGWALVLSQVGSALALDSAGWSEFNRIMGLNMEELTEASAELLAQKYPNEPWESWHFPSYVLTGRDTEVSYKIAVKEPRLLGLANQDDKHLVIPCYCTCERSGHANLLYCFWKDGQPGGEFDKHGSECAVCKRQAFLAFLWSDLGASHAEIMQGMEKKFAPLIRMIEEGKL